jgi:hypothetical protein
LYDQFVFEPEFRGGVDVSFDSVGKLHIGAGLGGGPRHQVRDSNFRVLSDSFEGDPNSRFGAALYHGSYVGGYSPGTHDLQQFYFATPFRESPGDTTQANVALSFLPVPIQRSLANYPAYIYNADYLSNLPSFSYLTDDFTEIEGDGNRTWAQVAGWATSDYAIINQGQPWLILHEVAHHLQPQSWDAFFKPEYARTVYELNSSEAWAESFRRFYSSEYVIPEIREYINGLGYPFSVWWSG